MKKYFLISISLLLLVPVEAFASTQVILGSTGAGAMTASTYAFFGGDGSVNNSGVTGGTLPVNGSLSNLAFHAKYQPGSTAARKMVVQKNAAATALTCTIGGASTDCIDTTHTIFYTAGDALDAVFSVKGTPTGSEGSWSAVFTASTTNDTIILGQTTNNGSNARTWLGFAQAAVSSTESTRRQVFPEGGTVDRLFASTPTFTSGTYEYTVWQNAASSTLDCIITTSGPCNDTTHSFSVSSLDNFDLGQLPASPGASSKVGFGVRYVPTTPGNFPLFATSGSNNADTAGGTRYLSASGSVSNSLEASTTQIVGNAMVITNMVVHMNSAPGTSKTATTTLRVNNTDSGISCTITGNAATTCTVSGTLNLLPTDLIDVSVQLTSGGTVSGGQVAFSARPPTTSTNAPIFLTDTSATTWTVPSDWTNTNTIECIGAGGNGAAATGLGTSPGAGGGGGSYAEKVNQVLTPGSTVTIAIAAGGSGNDTKILDNSSAAIITCGAGANASTVTGGAGGTATGGSVQNAGGNGGSATNNTARHGGGGGGGAAGRTGVGQVGGAGGTAIGSAGGGGGGSAGTSATAGTDAGANTNGVAGGAGTFGTGAGQGGSATFLPVDGIYGGGGGSGPTTAAFANGAAGGIDAATYINSTYLYGSGGGGGGGGGNTTTGGNGGAGGPYGGGGGGGGAGGTSNGAAGSGGQGILIITYVHKAMVQIRGASVRIKGGRVRIQ